MLEGRITTGKQYISKKKCSDREGQLQVKEKPEKRVSCETEILMEVENIISTF